MRNLIRANIKIRCGVLYLAWARNRPELALLYLISSSGLYTAIYLLCRIFPMDDGSCSVRSPNCMSIV